MSYKVKPPLPPPSPDQLARMTAEALGIGGRENVSKIKSAILQAIVDRDEWFRKAIAKAGNQHLLGHIDIGKWIAFQESIEQDLLLIG